MIDLHSYYLFCGSPAARILRNEKNPVMSVLRYLNCPCSQCGRHEPQREISIGVPFRISPGRTRNASNIERKWINIESSIGTNEGQAAKSNTVYRLSNLVWPPHRPVVPPRRGRAIVSLCTARCLLRIRGTRLCDVEKRKRERARTARAGLILGADLISAFRIFGYSDIRRDCSTLWLSAGALVKF
jgi:hypothetical protein